MRHPNVGNLITQMNGITKIDKLAKKHIVLDGVVKVGGGCLVQVCKVS